MRFNKSLMLGLITMVMSLGFNPTAHADIELGKALKEIFVKGSLDGDKLFLVLGMEQAGRIFNSAMENAVDVEELKDFSEDAARAIRNQSQRVWNANHDGDVIDNVGRAARVSVESADDIFKWPWRSLSKIPGSFKVGLNDAREARANANNSVSGTLAYSGLATWTLVKGSYYLVIEAPVKFVAALATTTLAVPATLAYEAVRLPIAIALGVGKGVIRLGWIATKAVVMGSVALGAVTYSALSTGAAAIATTAAAVTVAAVRLTAKIINMPFTIFKKGMVEAQTSINYRDIKDFSEVLPGILSSDILSKLGVDNDMTVADIRIEDHKAVITLRSKLDADKEALVLKVGITFNTNKDEQNLNLQAFLKLGHYKQLKKATGLSGRKLKRVIENNLENLLGQALLIYQNDEDKTDSKAAELALAI